MKMRAARRLLAVFRRFAGQRLPILWLLMAGSALAEGFGIVMLIPVLAAATDAGDSLGALWITQSLPSLSGRSATGTALLLFLLLMVLRALLLYCRDVRMARLEAEYTADLRL